MKIRELPNVIFLMVVLFLCGCTDTQENALENQQSAVGEKSKLDITENEYVTITINSVSAVSAEVLVSNNSDCTIEFGTWFAIEAERDGEYYELMQIQLPDGEEWAWEEVLYSVSGGEKFTQPINWEKYYGNLPTGNYRIVKAFSSPDLRDDEFPNMRAEDFYVACEFVI